MDRKTREVIQSLATYFASSKTILKCQGHLKVKLYLFKKVLGLVEAIRGELIQSLATYFASSKTILKCQGHLRVKLYLLKKVLGLVGTIWGNWVKNCNS